MVYTVVIMCYIIVRNYCAMIERIINLSNNLSTLSPGITATQKEHNAKCQDVFHGNEVGWLDLIQRDSFQFIAFYTLIYFLMLICLWKPAPAFIPHLFISPRRCAVFTDDKFPFRKMS
jgi:hypothetical protein